MATPSMPSRGDRNAPTFESTKPRELPRYFSDLEYQFTRCNITDNDEKKSHATRFLSVRDADAWEALTEFFTPTNTYAEFKDAVLNLYPGTAPGKKYSLADLDTLVGAHARTGIHSRGDFSEFYRDFSTISTYLIKQGELSPKDQTSAFRRAMQPDSLRESINLQLRIMKPRIGLTAPHNLADLKEAAELVLEDTSTSITSSIYTTPSAPQTKQESEFTVLVTKLIEVLAVNGQNSHHSLAHASHPQQQPHAPYPPRNSNPRPDGCIYCSGPHYIGNCDTVTADAQAGYCKRDVNGRVVLPSGAFVPRHIQGHNLRERIQEYHRTNPNQVAAAQMMLDTHQNFTYAHQGSNRLTIEECQRCLDQENEASEKLCQAQYIQTRTQARRAAEAGGPVEEPEQPIRRVLPRLRPVVESTPAPSVPNRFAAAPARVEAPTQHIPEHPYAQVRDAADAEPKGRNFGVQSPPVPPAKRNEPAYRSAPPVLDNKVVSNVFERSMDAPVTISQRELLSLAPDVRSHYKEVTTSRRIAVEPHIARAETQLFNTVEDTLPFESEPTFVFNEPESSRDAETAFSTFTNSMPAAFQQTVEQELPYDALIAQDEFATLYDAGVMPDPGDMHVAVDSCAIRSVYPSWTTNAASSAFTTQLPYTAHYH
ncbi:hypothetical protein B0H13DRAFT_2432885 [Mycena leptocephala]|nr:hypothetical protein B0H13DRAFT_2432885 [Mycena leptocephala]